MNFKEWLTKKRQPQAKKKVEPAVAAPATPSGEAKNHNLVINYSTLPSGVRIYRGFNQTEGDLPFGIGADLCRLVAAVLDFNNASAQSAFIKQGVGRLKPQAPGGAK